MVLEVAGVRLTADIDLATILGESEEGLSLKEIADKTGVDELKLGRQLFALRIRHLLILRCQSVFYGF